LSAVCLIVAANPVGLNRGKAHMGGMENSHSNLLDVTVKPDRPPRWEWQVCSDGEMIANGFEDEQEKAKFQGYHAVFQLLAAGWNP
jgi:hypothetical protein